MTTVQPSIALLTLRLAVRFGLSRASRCPLIRLVPWWSLLVSIDPRQTQIHPRTARMKLRLSLARCS